MDWKFDESRSIWQQIREQIIRRILSGEYESGSKMPSVRDLAAQAGVNPNTMQRALLSLDETGLTTADRTKGRIVTAQEDKLVKIRRELAGGYAREYLGQVRELSMDLEDALRILKEESKNE